MLAMICSTVSGCANFDADKDIPKVTWVQVDTKNNRLNPFPVTRYNDEDCKMETGKLPPIPLKLEDGSVNPQLHGGFWISHTDLLALIGCAKEQCIKHRDSMIEQNKRHEATRHVIHEN